MEIIMTKEHVVLSECSEDRLKAIERASEQKISVPVWEKVTLTIEEACAYSNIGMGTIRKLLKEPGCPFVLYIGRKKLIKRKEFEQFISKSVSVEL